MPEPTPPDPLLESLVASAEDGAIGFWLIVNVVKSVRGEITERSDDDARAATLSLVREALRRRVLVAGTMDGQFEAWHLSPDDAIERIDKAWSELGRDPIPGEVATFATPGRLGFS
jgi:hypothetical protein